MLQNFGDSLTINPEKPRRLPLTHSLNMARTAHPIIKFHRILKWSGKFGQRAKMYPTRTNGYENDKATELFRQV